MVVPSKPVPTIKKKDTRHGPARPTGEDRGSPSDYGFASEQSPRPASYRLGSALRVIWLGTSDRAMVHGFESFVRRVSQRRVRAYYWGVGAGSITTALRVCVKAH